MGTTSSHRRGAAGVLAVTAVALTMASACASPQAGEAVAAPGPPPSSSRTAPPSTSSAPEHVGKATKPLTDAGTALKYGQEAVVENPLGSKIYTIGIVPVKVEKGSFEELRSAGIKIEEKTSAGRVPYYLTYKMVNRMEGAVESMTTPNRFSVLDKANKSGTKLLVIGLGGPKLSSCPSGIPPRGWSTDQEHTTCEIHMLPEGAEPGSLHYRLDTGRAPLTWTP
ncbi:hypothetical protein [Allokutzneria sp. NRRL B-24872]|uniref:hypothetical protein n=1 Tax=Allokutzneria sp. NRRL B-24872 TaxID=1137961 RepID=UPI000A3B74E4|nr:hypothetical protein [Allokutzneria sp. NRRL B-24872]